MTLNYKMLGRGDPVVILHGLFGMLDNWQAFGKQLSSDYTVFLLDLPNHGKSPHIPKMDYQILTDALQEFLEYNWIYQAAILGHSMGGKVAMQLALSHPDLISKLAVFDIAPKNYDPGHYKIIKALQGINLDEIQVRSKLEEELFKHIEDPRVVFLLAKNLRRTRIGRFEWKMNLEGISNSYESILQAPLKTGLEFDKQTIFYRGELSPYIAPDDEKLIQRYFPQATIQTIPRAGHWLHVDAFDALLREVKVFLAG